VARKLTRDEQFQHVDPVAAREMGFEGTIAHGMLTLSLFRAMYLSSAVAEPDGLKVAINYGSNRVRFTAQVPSGARIRGRFTLLDLTAKGDDALMETMQLVVEIEGSDRPAMVAELLILLQF
jgi:acyl dehydratase